jgi:hypothetical protein
MRVWPAQANQVARFVDHEAGEIEEQEAGGVAPGIEEKEE